MSVLTDLATRLQDAGVGTLNIDVFRGRMPDEPTLAVTVQTYARDNSRLRDADYLAADERLNVQIMARGDNQAAAEALAESAWDAVQGRSLTLTSGRFYPYVRAPRYPAYVGVDERGRHMVSFDLEVRRLRSSL